MTLPSTHPFTGLLAYPITPVAGDAPDDAPDLDALSALVARIAEGRADAVVVLASSGAGTSFRDAERAEIVRAATQASGGLPVHVGISAASRWQAVENAKTAERAGASGLVLAPFSYTPLTGDEVVGLYGAVAAATGLPVCFYNKPLQTGYDLTVDVLARLAALGAVVGVKDPARLPDRPNGRVSDLRAAGGPDVSVGLSGDVALVQDAEPADAWHTGLAALVPREYAAVRRARAAGRTGTEPEGAAAGRAWLLDLARVLATLRPVSGLHALAALLGTPTGPPRLPSLPVPQAGVTALRAVVARRP